MFLRAQSCKKRLHFLNQINVCHFKTWTLFHRVNFSTLNCVIKTCVQIWKDMNRMELLCVWVKIPASSLRSSWVMWLFYSLPFWLVSQSLWNADAVFTVSWGINTLSSKFNNTLFKVLSKLLHLHFVCAKNDLMEYSSNLNIHYNSWPSSRTQNGW